jgi:hypothetical protein
VTFGARSAARPDDWSAKSPGSTNACRNRLRCDRRAMDGPVSPRDVSVIINWQPKGFERGQSTRVSRWPPLAPNRSHNRTGTRLIDTLETVECRIGQVGCGSGDPAKQDDALFIGDRC